MKSSRPYISSESLFKTNASARIPMMIAIPEGEFTMGTSIAQVNSLMAKEEWALEWFDQELFNIEQPQHQVKLNAFSIAINPVTNIEYYIFAYNTGYRVPKTWVGFQYPDNMAEHPVTGVSKIDAEAYCKWASEQTGKNFRLPTEAEWERAARGTDTRIYPWGDDFDPWRCNTSESAKKGTTQVGAYAPIGNSPTGAMDMVGNVWELTRSILAPYPYNPDDGREEQGTNEKYVIRGGSWYYTRKLARCAAREGALATFTSPAMGFRLASSDVFE